MRKARTGITIALAVAAMACLRVPAVWAQAEAAPSVESLSRELDKNKQLLEIWKDHVKRLTRERDALKEKVQGEPDAGQITKLESRIATLEAENRRLEAESRSLKSAAGPDQRQQMLEREIKELRADNGVLADDKERALAELERLKKAPPAGQDIDKLKDENEKLRRSYNYLDADLRTVREKLKEENRQVSDKLKQVEGQAAKAALLEDELANLRRGWDEKAAENRQISESLKQSEAQAVKAVQALKAALAKTGQLESEAARLAAENRQLSEKLAQTEGEVVKTGEALGSQIERLKAEQADLQKKFDTLKDEQARGMIQLEETQGALSQRQAELKKAGEDRDIANQAYADLGKETENLRQYITELKGLQKKRLQEIKAGIDAYLDKSLV